MLIAPAWDMTERLMWARFPESIRKEIIETGVYLRPSRYGDGPYPITRGLIEEGRHHLIGAEAFDPGRPVHILHGLQDPDVPWEHTLDLVAHLGGDWTRVSAVPDGDHRLSRPEDLALLLSILDRLDRVSRNDYGQRAGHGGALAVRSEAGNPSSSACISAAGPALAARLSGTTHMIVVIGVDALAARQAAPLQPALRCGHDLLRLAPVVPHDAHVDRHQHAVEALEIDAAKHTAERVVAGARALPPGAEEAQRLTRRQKIGVHCRDRC